MKRRRHPPVRFLRSPGPSLTKNQPPEPRRKIGSRLKDIANSQRVTGVVSLFTSVFFAYLAVSGIQLDAHTGTSAGVANGTIVEVHDGDNSYVTVQFVARSGQQVRTNIEDFMWQPTPRVGDTAKVRYDPSNPVRYARDDRMSPDFFSPGFATAASFTFLLAAVAGWRRRLPSWLVRR
jgi:hypothetical protein